MGRRPEIEHIFGLICRRQIDFFMLFMSFMVKKIFVVFKSLPPLRVLRGRKIVGVAFFSVLSLELLSSFDQCLSVSTCVHLCPINRGLI